MSKELRINGIYPNNDFKRILKAMSEGAVSGKELMQKVLTLYKFPTENVGKATRFDQNNGTPTKMELVPHEPSRITEFFLENRYLAKKGYDGWFFKGERLPLKEDVAAALHAAWTRSTRNVVYTVHGDNEGVDDFHYVAVDKIEHHDGGHNDSGWDEKVLGFELMASRPASDSVLNILALNVEA